MTSLVPPFGWAFPHEGFDRAVTGSNFEDLIARVIQFRVDNRIPLGNPEQEIENYICEKYPAHCNPLVEVRPKQEFVPRTLHDRVAQWAANRYEQAGSITYVPQDEANRRASICASCPQNERNWMNNCPPCRDDIQRTLLLLRQNQNTLEKPNLGACRIAGHENNTAAWLPEKLLRHRVRYEEQLPDFCWMKGLEKH